MRSATVAGPPSSASPLKKDTSHLPRTPRPPAPTGGLRLEGQVIDDQDQPIGGATVALVAYSLETTTAQDGSFAFDHLGPAYYALASWKGEDSYSDVASVELSETSDPVIVRVHPGAAATVHVIDEESKEPVVGATVSDRQTDATATVRVHGLPPGRNTSFLIEAAGYEPRQVEMMVSGDLKAPNELTASIRRGARVSGTVVDPNGQPLADAAVEVIGESGSQRAGTDASGAWHIDTVAAGHHVFRAASERYRTSDEVALDLDGRKPREGITIRVEVDGDLGGIVVDGSGNGVGSAMVVASAFAGGATLYGTTEVDGHFVLAGPHGRFQVHAAKGPLASAPEEVDLLPKKHVEVRLVVDRSSITGAVVDPRGRPVVGARVSATSSLNIGSYESHIATSDAKGRFEVTGVVPGEYELSAERPDHEVADTRRTVAAKSGDSGVKIVLPEVSTLSGRVLLEGKPVPYYGVYITEPEPQWLAYPLEVRSTEGRFAKHGVPAGMWRVTFAGPGFAPKTLKNVSIPDGRDLDLGDVMVDHGQHVGGHVLDARGAPIAGASVTVHTRASSFNDAVLDLIANGTLSTVTDQSGAYQLDGISPPAIAGLTNHIVATQARLGTSGERELSASDSNVDLVIAAAGGIDGRVVGPPGVPQVVGCFQGSDSAFDVTTSPDELGQFHFNNLAPGDYSVRVYSAGAVLRPVHVRVTARKRADVVIEIPTTAVTLAVHVDGGCKRLSVKTDDTAQDLLLEKGCDGSSVTIYGLPPGPYRLCPDAASCTSVKVLADPDKQTVEIAAHP